MTILLTQPTFGSYTRVIPGVIHKSVCLQNGPEDKQAASPPPAGLIRMDRVCEAELLPLTDCWLACSLPK